MSERVRVAPESAFESTDRKIVEVDGEEVGVIKYDGEYYAISNACSHRNGPVCDGTVQGSLVGEFVAPGERVEERFSDDPSIACPWHGWEYDLETGRHLGDPAVSIETYDVVIEDGTIYIE